MEKKKEKRKQTFSSAPPSVKSTSIDQWEINALTAAVSVNEMFGGAIQKTHPRGFAHGLRQIEANGDTQQHAHLSSH